MSTDNKKLPTGVFARLCEAYLVPIKRGWQKELASKVKVETSVVSTWKKRGIPERIISNAAIESGVTKEWLNSGEGPMRPEATAQPPPRATLVTIYTGDERRAQPIVAEGPYCSIDELSKEHRHLLNLWDSADSTSRRNAMMILEDSAKQSRMHDGGGSDSMDMKFEEK